jgi:hypothetical protein
MLMIVMVINSIQYIVIVDYESCLKVEFGWPAHAYFQRGTPASALARVTPAKQQASHSTTPKPNTIPMALGREHPIRFCMY